MIAGLLAALLAITPTELVDEAMAASLGPVTDDDLARAVVALAAAGDGPGAVAGGARIESADRRARALLNAARRCDDWDLRDALLAETAATLARELTGVVDELPALWPVDDAVEPTLALLRDDRVWRGSAARSILAARLMPTIQADAVDELAGWIRLELDPSVAWAAFVAVGRDEQAARAAAAVDALPGRPADHLLALLRWTGATTWLESLPRRWRQQLADAESDAARLVESARLAVAGDLLGALARIEQVGDPVLAAEASCRLAGILAERGTPSLAGGVLAAVIVPPGAAARLVELAAPLVAARIDGAGQLLTVATSAALEELARLERRAPEYADLGHQAALRATALAGLDALAAAGRIETVLDLARRRPAGIERAEALAGLIDQQPRIAADALAAVGGDPADPEVLILRLAALGRAGAGDAVRTLLAGLPTAAAAAHAERVGLALGCPAAATPRPSEAGLPAPIVRRRLLATAEALARRRVEPHRWRRP